MPTQWQASGPVLFHAPLNELDAGQAATYQLRMPVRLFRQIVSVLLMVAYLSATFIGVAPVANAAPGVMTGGMMTQDGQGGEMPMPCKSMKSGCVTELGCIFMVSLPAADLSAGTPLAWSPVTYSVSPEFLLGRSTKPALGPPRSLT
jgi:hypothetical protein